MSKSKGSTSNVFESKPGTVDQVLVADDDPMYRAVLKRWLEEWGYDVTLVPDGAKAWH